MITQELETDIVIEHFRSTALKLRLGPPRVRHETHILSTVQYVGEALGVFFSIERMCFYLQVYLFACAKDHIPSTYNERYVQRGFVDVSDAVTQVGGGGDPLLSRFKELLKTCDYRQCGILTDVISTILEKYWYKLVERYGWKNDAPAPENKNTR